MIELARMVNASSPLPGKAPLRVLIASRHLPECTGGLAAYQRGLAVELGRRPDMEVCFLAAEKGGPEPRIQGPLPAPSQVLNCPCNRRAWMSMASRPFLHPLLKRGIAAAFRKAIAGSQWHGFSNERSPDVVHFVGTGWDLAGFGFLELARKAGARFTVWPAIHPGQWGDDVIDLQLYRAADAVFCQSRFEVAHIEHRGVSSKKTVLCGLPPMCLPRGNGRALRERWGPGKGPFVLFLGRRDEAKGYPALLEAWKMVLLQNPDALLILSGPGGTGYEPLLNSLPARSFLDLGIADEETKSNALAACDLFCLPSSQESFGIVYAEAWSYGKPVICGPAPASREWIAASGGGEWSEQNPEDLAKVLIAMLAAPALSAAMGTSGKQFQRRTLTWDAVVSSHLYAFGIG